MWCPLVPHKLKLWGALTNQKEDICSLSEVMTTHIQHTVIIPIENWMQLHTLQLFTWGPILKFLLPYCIYE